MSIPFFYISKKRFLFVLWGLFLLWILFLFWINTSIISFSSSFIYKDVNQLPSVKVWLVLGARVKQSWAPSDILKDRLDGAKEAYKIGKIQKIIVSGDNGTKTYDEPTNMQAYLVNAGIPEKDIYIDYAGFDTYDSIYRAREIFSVSQVIIFTQNFHLYRSLFIARSLWIEAYGFASDYHIYISERRNNLRESLARIKAWFDVKVWHAKPKFLGEKVIIN